MGRWVTKGRGSEVNTPGAFVESSSAAPKKNQAAGECIESALKQEPNGGYTKCASACEAPVAVKSSIEQALDNCSLSQEEKRNWLALSASVLAATPAPGFQKGPPPPDAMAALKAARDQRDTFVAGLTPEQQKEVLLLLELEKQERKQMAKVAPKVSAQTPDKTPPIQKKEAPAGYGSLNDEQKEVMRQAFWLWQKDRQKEAGSQYIESTEWKRIRAIGGSNATLRHYIKLAGWKSSWPMPEPEGRAYRREEHAAKVKAQS